MTTAPIALRHSGTVTVAGPFRLTPAGLEVAGARLAGLPKV